MVRPLYVVLLMLLLSSIAYIPHIYSQESNIEKIDMIIAYDLYSNSGITVCNISFTETLSNAIVDFPLISNNIEIVNVTSGEGNYIPFNYVEENKTITLYVNNTDKITITYMVSNLFDEVSLGMYSSVVDLSIYSGLTIDVELHIGGKYNITSEPENVTYSYTEDETIIKLDKPILYTLTLWETPVYGTPSTPTTSPTTTTTYTPTSPTTPTSTPTKTTESSPETKETSPAGGGLSGTTIAIIIIVLLVIIAVVLWLKKK